MNCRGTPSTVGDAINLTPNALCRLDHLVVLQHLEGKGSIARFIEIFSAFSGQRIAELSYRDTEKIQYYACRIPRAGLLQAILADRADLKVEYGKKLASVTEREESVTATFEDGSTTQPEGDIMLAYTHVPV